MKLFLEFSPEEVQTEIPYQIIAETTSRSIWNTGRRKRLMAELFTDYERNRISEIKMQAHIWAFVKGVPKKGVKMTIRTYKLWHKLAEFCASI